uniref:Sec-independent protein translocase protein TatB n=1 Tax=Ningiella ruwaisensis TaxID=2364274 RepID=UPI00109FA107|nr:Sec-independent protein translocase protein TatB [Ningiella ruwaisensis]
MPFDIGFIELCILLIVGLIVLGPDKLPVAARQLSKWFGGIRRNVNSFTSEINRELEMDELRRQVESQKQKLNSVMEAKAELESESADMPPGKLEKVEQTHVKN